MHGVPQVKSLISNESNFIYRNLDSTLSQVGYEIEEKLIGSNLDKPKPKSARPIAIPNLFALKYIYEYGYKFALLEFELLR